MVNTSTKQLFNQLNESEVLIRNKNINSDEKLALAGYIVNLYRALICMGRGDVDFDRKKCFGGDRSYNKLIKKIGYYSDKLIDNFLKNKKFHKNFFSEILPDIEEMLSKIEYLEVDETSFSRNDFLDIVFHFMKSINLSDLFDKLYKDGHIYSTIIGQDKRNLGSTLYNPLNGDSDIFIKDLQYSLNDMNTMVHELGHVYDFSRFDGNIYQYNNYFYLSFYGEVMSRLFERLFFKYMRDHNIKKDGINNLQVEFELLNHSFLLQAFILSVLPDKYISEDKYLDFDSNEIVRMIERYFFDESSIREFVENVESFDLSEVYNYAYGDIISMFLFNEVNRYGFNNEMIDYFLKNRCDSFDENYLRECGYGPRNYVKLYRKNIKPLKNNCNN